jgi:hypothetical protein
MAIPLIVDTHVEYALSKSEGDLSPENVKNQIEEVATELHGVDKKQLFDLCAVHIQSNLEPRSKFRSEIFLTSGTQEAFIQSDIGDFLVDDIPVLDSESFRTHFRDPIQMETKTGNVFIYNSCVFFSRRPSNGDRQLTITVDGVKEYGDKVVNISSMFSIRSNNIGDDLKIREDESSIEAAAMRVAIASTIYYVSSDPDALRRVNPDYDKAIRKAKKFKGNKKRRETAKAKKKKDEHFIIDVSMSILQKRAGPLSGKSVMKNSGKISFVSRHRVKRHRRFQRYGPGRKLVKEIYIEPHYRGSDKRKLAHIAIK